MKITLRLLAVALFILLGCGKEDDILPAPPRTENVTSPGTNPEEVDNGSEPPVDVDGEVFQYGLLGSLPYRILIPRHYDSTKNYPLHLFLHGIGERGQDNEKQLLMGASHFQADSVRERYPAFVVFPQCPTTAYWFSSDIMRTLRSLVDTLKAYYRIDENKISIGGFSMGGYGSFAMVARYPELFETALAISGDGDPESAEKMAKPRWQIYAGEKDDIVPWSKTEKMARALVKAGASVSFKLYPRSDHDHTWMHAFSEPDFFNKIFADNKRGPEAAGH